MESRGNAIIDSKPKQSTVTLWIARRLHLLTHSLENLVVDCQTQRQAVLMKSTRSSFKENKEVLANFAVHEE